MKLVNQQIEQLWEQDFQQADGANHIEEAKDRGTSQDSSNDFLSYTTTGP
jgi:hypothetical protein